MFSLWVRNQPIIYYYALWACLESFCEGNAIKSFGVTGATFVLGFEDKMKCESYVQLTWYSIIYKEMT